jgi:hypothetical protein
MNHTRSRPPLLCSHARDGDRRRKPPQPPWCTVACHHLPQKRSWADAATPAHPLETLPAHARAKGVTFAKTSAPLGKDNPLSVTGGYRSVSGSVAAGTRGRPATSILARVASAGARAALTALPRARAATLAGWPAGLLARAGDLIFAANDEEAAWRGWNVERQRGGLSRVYRDPAFDLLVSCRQCRSHGTIATGTPCAPCSGTGRLVVDQPAIAPDG